MGYGQGDYGQGDYGQGDPGFFDFIGKAVHAVAGVVSHLGIPGVSQVAGIINAVSGAGGGSIGHVIPESFGGGGSPFGGAPMGAGLMHPTDQTSIGPGGMLYQHTNYAPAGARGFHVIRKGKNAGKMTRNRRMNVTNPKALRRAIRRGHGFEKMAKRILGFSSPQKPKGRMYFRKKRRAA